MCDIEYWQNSATIVFESELDESERLVGGDVWCLEEGTRCPCDGCCRGVFALQLLMRDSDQLCFCPDCRVDCNGDELSNDMWGSGVSKSSGISFMRSPAT